MTFTSFACGDEEEEVDGLVNIRMDVYESMLTQSSGSQATKLAWACLIVSSSQTTCVYAYNGSVQTDASITEEASSRGPGTTGFNFVENGTIISGLPAGTREYFVYQAQFLNGEELSGTVNESGEIDVYANKGSDRNVAIGFGTAGNPTQDDF